MNQFAGNVLTAYTLPFLFPNMRGQMDLFALLGVVQLDCVYLFPSIKHVTALSIVIPIIEPISTSWVFLVLGEAPGKWAVYRRNWVVVFIKADV